MTGGSFINGKSPNGVDGTATTESNEGPDDLESIWETLWGPRGEDGPGRGFDARSGPSSGKTPESPDGRATETGGADVIETVGAVPEELRSHFQAALTQQMAMVRSELLSEVADLVASRSDQVGDELRQSVARLTEMVEAQHAEWQDRATTELTDLRSQLDVSAARRLDQVSAELMAAVESRFLTAADLDPLRAVAARIADAVSSVERDLFTKTDLAALRSDMQAEMNDQLAVVRGEAAEASGRAAEASGRAAEGAVAGREALARVDVVERHLSGRLTDLQESTTSELQRLAQTVEARQAELVTAADLDAFRADVVARVTDALTSVQGELLTQTDMVALRAEMTDLSGQLAVVRQEAGEAEVGALRADLEAVQRKIGALDAAVSAAEEQLVERLDDLAGWVVAEATRKAKKASAATNALAPVRSDLQGLQEQVRQINAVVAELQQRLPGSPRKLTPPVRKPALPAKAVTEIGRAPRRTPAPGAD